MVKGGSNPTWNDTIESYFSAPYWVATDRRIKVGAGWAGCMGEYALDLRSYESVKQWAPTIYEHLHSRSMPLTDDPTQYWPDAALEAFRTWVNEGCRQSDSDPIRQTDVIGPWEPPPDPVRVRKDILLLTQAELDHYRMTLDDVMHVADPAADSPWQVLGEIHTNWCLHYQEAFLMWHRSYLIYFEHLIGMSVPYWNWFAFDASVDGSASSGIPQAFKDETYVHPVSGETRPNPLRYASARGGRSKACELDDPAKYCSGDDCRWVQRDPLLYTEGDQDRDARSRKIAMLGLFQRQVSQALCWRTFSQAQGFPGYPWANIQEFDPPQPDKLYPNRTDFDGLYEQPHDNFHGWLGPDMADNSYTAFDPIFWSYHANIDRIFEIWLRENPAAMFTSGFPIRPFIGPRADAITPAEPRAWRYTTIGDMARDSRSMGYDFGKPRVADLPQDCADADEIGLYVVFEGVMCTHDSYTIDAFVNLPHPQPADVDAANPHYVGCFTRLGMGIVDDKGRCVTEGVTRILDATENRRKLDLKPGDDVTITIVVTDLTRQKTVPHEEWLQLPGFEPRLAWGGPWPTRKSNKSMGTGCPASGDDKPPTSQCCADKPTDPGENP